MRALASEKPRRIVQRPRSNCTGNVLRFLDETSEDNTSEHGYPRESREERERDGGVPLKKKKKNREEERRDKETAREVVHARYNVAT